MKVLFTGKGGKAGSWAMRGEQLGQAMGAVVKPNHVEDADVVVVVKRTPEPIIQALRGRKWVWDIVDAYPQPEAYKWCRDDAIRWVHERLKHLNPTGVIWPTHRMQKDCDTGIPGFVLPHHHRIGIEKNPIREKVRVVGYEGAESYLGRWRGLLEDECRSRGWRFVVNPAKLADLDIVVALRDGGGYVSKHWKSGVKLANAHASGTPFVGNPEHGYLENASRAEYWADDLEDLRMSFDWLESREARQSVQDEFLSHAYSVEKAASDLKGFLSAL